MKKELLFSITKKDFKIDWFSGKGAGGQYRNKHQNCIRLQHLESGVIVTGQSHRDRVSNQKEAINNLINHPQFKLWHSRKVMEVIENKTIEEKVEESMDEQNLRVEERDSTGKWVEYRDSDK